VYRDKSNNFNKYNNFYNILQYIEVKIISGTICTMYKWHLTVFFFVVFY